MESKNISLLVAQLLLVTTFTFIASPAFAALGDGGTAPIGGSGGGITNPLEQGGINTASDLLKKVINFMLGLVGFIALIALITGGARMIVDFGNEEQVKKGKTTILWAVIGLLVVLLSYAIINIVTGEILGGGGNTSTPYEEPSNHSVSGNGHTSF